MDTGTNLDADVLTDADKYSYADVNQHAHLYAHAHRYPDGDAYAHRNVAFNWRIMPHEYNRPAQAVVANTRYFRPRNRNSIGCPARMGTLGH